VRRVMPTTDAASLKARVARSMFWLVWSRGALQVLTFAATLVIARLLVPADYGIMALAGFWTGTVSMLAEMGLGAAIIQFRDLTRREIDTCFWMTIALAIILYAAVCLAAPLIGHWFDVPRLADVLPVLALVLPLTACRVVPDSLLRKRLALNRVSQAEVIGSVAALPVMLGCALVGLGVWALVIGALVGPTARTISTFAFSPWYPGFRVGGERIKDVIRFSLTTLGVRVLWALREWGNTLVVGKITGQVTIVGLYSMAEELALLPGSKISSVVNMLSAPVMAELQTNISAMRAAFLRAFRLTAAIALPTTAGLALIADELVAALLGAKWAATVPILRLLCVYAAVRAIDVLLPPVLFARRRERFLFWYCIALLTLVPTAAVLGALWDGAAGTVILSTPMYCAVMTIMVKEVVAELNGRYSELWSAMWPIVVATAAMSAVVLLLRQVALAGRSDSLWIGLTLSSVSGTLTYVAVLFAIGSPVISEGAEVVGWILHGHRARV